MRKSEELPRFFGTHGPCTGSDACYALATAGLSIQAGSCIGKEHIAMTRRNEATAVYTKLASLLGVYLLLGLGLPALLLVATTPEMGLYPAEPPAWRAMEVSVEAPGTRVMRPERGARFSAEATPDPDSHACRAGAKA
jgi:hypothetical protein